MDFYIWTWYVIWENTEENIRSKKIYYEWTVCKFAQIRLWIPTLSSEDEDELQNVPSFPVKNIPSGADVKVSVKTL